MNSIKTALHQIRRTPYQALIAISSLSLTFLALAVFIIISAGFHLIIQHFSSTPQVIAFFEKGKDLSEVQLNDIRNKLESTGKMSSFVYVSTKEAERIYKENNADEPLLNELVDYKILPPSIEISATDINYLPELKNILEQEPLVKDIAFYEDVVADASRWIDNIKLLGISMVGFLMLISLLLLIVIIGMKIKNKRFEIEIMRLLGASSWYIHGPFLIEGMIYGGLGAIFGWLGSFTLLQYSTPFLISWLDDIINLPVPAEILFSFLGVLTLAGMLFGGISSLIAVRRFMKI